MILWQLILQLFLATIFVILLMTAPQIENMQPGLAAILIAGMLIIWLNNMTSLFGTMALIARSPAMAEVFFRAALIHETILAQLPVRIFKTNCMSTQKQLLMALVARQKYEAALEVAQEVLLLAEKEFGLTSVETVEELIDLGSVYLQLNKHDLAEVSTKRALQIVETKGSNVSDREASAMAVALNNMGVAYADRRMPDKAQEMFKRALHINSNILKVSDDRLATNYGNQGYALLKAGNLNASEEMLQRAINLTKERTGENVIPVASFFNNLGEVRRQQGKLVEAEADLLASLDMREKHLLAGHEHFGYSYHNLGLIYLDLKDYAKSKDYLDKALLIRKKYPGVKSNELNETMDAQKRLAECKSGDVNRNTSTVAKVRPDLAGRKESALEKVLPHMVSFALTVIPLALLATGAIDKMIQGH